jgi:Uncharacterized protein conserved in bacteria (DUF2188)
MPKKDIHVVPHKDRWATRWEGAQRVSRTFDTQGEAYKSARNAARRELVEVVTHRRDGTIRDSDSFGRDPFPPRDRKH